MSQPPSDIVFFTPLKDCVVWTLRLLGITVAAVLVISLMVSFLRGQASAMTPGTVLDAAAFVLGSSAIVGVLIFFFGWLGRVIVSKEGLEVPRYSGLRQFFRWHDITDAETGSVSGWPCIIIRGRGSHAPGYLMVIGRRKSELAEWIRLHVDAANPLVQYFARHDA